jgi:hypothetical protein
MDEGSLFFLITQDEKIIEVGAQLFLENNNFMPAMMGTALYQVDQQTVLRM